MILTTMQQDVGTSVIFDDFGKHATKGGNKRDVGERAQELNNKHRALQTEH